MRSKILVKTAIGDVTQYPYMPNICFIAELIIYFQNGVSGGLEKHLSYEMPYFVAYIDKFRRQLKFKVTVQTSLSCYGIHPLKIAAQWGGCLSPKWYLHGLRSKCSDLSELLQFKYYFQNPNRKGIISFI